MAGNIRPHFELPVHYSSRGDTQMHVCSCPVAAPDVGDDRREVAIGTIKITMLEMGCRISEDRDLSSRSEVSQ